MTIRLKITNEVNGEDHSLNFDPNISPRDVEKIKKFEFRKRGLGPNNSLMGKAPNFVLIDLGMENQKPVWRSVVLPDDYNFETVKEVTLYDNRNPKDRSWSATADQKDASRWWAPKWGQKVESGVATAVEDSRNFAIENFLKEKFDFIGSVGVNDLSYLIVLHVPVPDEYFTKEFEEQLYSAAEELRNTYKVPFDIQVTSSVAGVARRPSSIMEGHLGETRHPEHAMSGRHPIEPVGEPVGAGPTQTAGVNPTLPLRDHERKPGLPGNTQEYGGAGINTDDAPTRRSSQE